MTSDEAAYAVRRYAVLRQRTVVITEMENNKIRYEKNIIINSTFALILQRE